MNHREIQYSSQCSVAHWASLSFFASLLELCTGNVLWEKKNGFRADTSIIRDCIYSERRVCQKESTPAASVLKILEEGSDGGGAAATRSRERTRLNSLTVTLSGQVPPWRCSPLSIFRRIRSFLRLSSLQSSPSSDIFLPNIAYRYECIPRYLRKRWWLYLRNKRMVVDRKTNVIFYLVPIMFNNSTVIIVFWIMNDW